MTSIDEQVDKIEEILHPRGRCTECGGGEPYWKHGAGDPLAGYHVFQVPMTPHDRLALLEALSRLPTGPLECTFHRRYESMCGKSPTDPVHAQDDERMGAGRHVYRHDAIDAARLRSTPPAQDAEDGEL